MFKIDESLKSISVESTKVNNSDVKFTYGQTKTKSTNINFLEEYSKIESIDPAYIDAIEKLDWTIHEYDGDVELENWSPAGEDLIVYATKANFVQDIVSYAENFDPDEHIEMWVEAKRTGSTSGIPSIRELVEDADAIEEMLNELANTLQAIELDNNTMVEYYTGNNVENDAEYLKTDIMRYLDVELPDIIATAFEQFQNNKDSFNVFKLDRVKALLTGAYNYIDKTCNELSKGDN